MDAWGILMTAITLLGMLVLTVAHVNLNAGSSSKTFDTQQDAPETEHAGEMRKAA